MEDNFVTNSGNLYSFTAYRSTICTPTYQQFPDTDFGQTYMHILVCNL